MKFLQQNLNNFNVYFVAGFQRQTTPNGNGNSNGNVIRDPISPAHNDSSDYKYGKLVSVQ